MIKIAQKIAGDLQGRDLLLRSSEMQRPKFKTQRERARTATRRCVEERIVVHLVPTLALMERLAEELKEFHDDEPCIEPDCSAYKALTDYKAWKKEQG